jgi:hypothetical protein
VYHTHHQINKLLSGGTGKIKKSQKIETFFISMVLILYIVI